MQQILHGLGPSDDEVELVMLPVGKEVPTRGRGRAWREAPNELQSFFECEAACPSGLYDGNLAQGFRTVVAASSAPGGCANEPEPLVIPER